MKNLAVRSTLKLAFACVLLCGTVKAGEMGTGSPAPPPPPPPPSTNSTESVTLLDAQLLAWLISTFS